MKKYKRFFAFGCSFTKWKWPTWADVLADHLDIEYHNLAEPAVGNEYIFHKIVETNAIHKFTKDDLVIVCWTNFAREDRYKDSRWIPSGNIYNYQVYNKQWVDQWFDLKGALLKTNSFIAATTHILEHTDYLFTSMMPVNLINKEDDIYRELSVDDILNTYQFYFINFLPSMVEYLYDSLPYCRNPEPQIVGDHHPSEKQHKQYVQEVILPCIQQDT